MPEFMKVVTKGKEQYTGIKGLDICATIPGKKWTPYAALDAVMKIQYPPSLRSHSLSHSCLTLSYTMSYTLPYTLSLLSRIPPRFRDIDGRTGKKRTVGVPGRCTRSGKGMVGPFETTVVAPPGFVQHPGVQFARIAVRQQRMQQTSV